MNQSSHFTETESVNGVLTGLEGKWEMQTREDSNTCDFTQPGDAMNSSESKSGVNRQGNSNLDAF